MELRRSQLVWKVRAADLKLILDELCYLCYNTSRTEGEESLLLRDGDELFSNQKYGKERSEILWQKEIIMIY